MALKGDDLLYLGLGAGALFLVYKLSKPAAETLGGVGSGLSTVAGSAGDISKDVSQVTGSAADTVSTILNTIRKPWEIAAGLLTPGQGAPQTPLVTPDKTPFLGKLGASLSLVPISPLIGFGAYNNAVVNEVKKLITPASAPVTVGPQIAGITDSYLFGKGNTSTLRTQMTTNIVKNTANIGTVAPSLLNSNNAAVAANAAAWAASGREIPLSLR